MVRTAREDLQKCQQAQTYLPEAQYHARPRVQTDVSNTHARRTLRKTREGLQTHQNGLEDPKTTWQPHTHLVQAQYHTQRSQAWKLCGCIRWTRACAGRSNRRENGCKSNRRRQYTPEQVKAAELACWRNNLAHRRGGWLRADTSTILTDTSTILTDT